MPRAKLSQDLGRLDPAGPRYATDVVEHVLAQARAAEASDVHFQPGADGLEVRWRIDGVLQPVALLPARGRAQRRRPAQGAGRAVDLPHRRAAGGADPGRARRGRDAALHVPHRCSARRPWCGCSRRRAGSSGSTTWGCPPRSVTALSQVLDETSGAVILAGPAGSGKTTHDLRLPARAGRPVAGRAQPGHAGRPHRGRRRRAWPSPRSTRRPG